MRDMKLKINERKKETRRQSLRTVVRGPWRRISNSALPLTPFYAILVEIGRLRKEKRAFGARGNKKQLKPLLNPTAVYRVCVISGSEGCLVLTNGGYRWRGASACIRLRKQSFHIPVSLLAGVALANGVPIQV